jgi:calcineurin-like phosphoesterase family protein
MQWFISSDYHAYHANIILHANRPFCKPEDLNEKGFWKSPKIACKRAIEMTEIIIKNHNQRVKPKDYFVHNGDLLLRSANFKGNGLDYKASEFLERLNGIPILLSGNHDKKGNSVKTKIQSLVLQGPGYQIKVTHKPVHANPSYPINLCGHTHDKEKIRTFQSLYDFMKLESQRTDLPQKYIKSCKQFVSKWKNHPKNSVIINTCCDAYDFYPISFEEVIGMYNSWMHKNKRR